MKILNEHLDIQDTAKDQDPLDAGKPLGQDQIILEDPGNQVIKDLADCLDTTSTS